MAFRLYGLLGHPLEHSFSMEYFSEKFMREEIKAGYTNFDLPEIDQLPGLISSEPLLAGFNVTIPYKLAVIQYLDELDDVAAKIGAVNTVKIIKSTGKTLLRGYNTDLHGFTESIKPFLKKGMAKALVLGTGGASMAVRAGLEELGIDFTLVSRNPSADTVTYSELNQDLLDRSPIIINTTPVGQYPSGDTCPNIPYDGVTPQHLLFDLVYNPETTLFMKKGQERGATVVNGLKMLQLQAEKSWEIWRSDN